MRITKIIVLLLCTALFVGIMAGCSETEQDETQPSTVQTEPKMQKPEINPMLLELHWGSTNTERIHELMNRLQKAYIDYTNSGNLIAFGEEYDSIKSEYSAFIENFGSEAELSKKHPDIDAEKKATMDIIISSVSSLKVDPYAWWAYKSDLEFGTNLSEGKTDADIEKSLIDAINNHAVFFYGKDII